MLEKLGLIDIILIFIFIVESIVDLKTPHTNNCFKNTGGKKLPLTLFTVFHHSISVLITFAWLSNTKIVLQTYMIVTIGTLISWMLEKDGDCIFTVWVNKICGYDKHKGFNNMASLLNMPRNNNYIVAYVIFGLCVAYYKLKYMD